MFEIYEMFEVYENENIKQNIYFIIQPQLDKWTHFKMYKSN